MYIKDKDLIIRNTQAEDASTITAWWNDGQIMAHAGFPNGLGISIEKVRNIILKNTDLSRLCVIVYHDVSIGEMSYSMTNDTAEIGIKICNQEMQEKGLGSRLIHLFIEDLFNTYSVEHIVLDTNLNNTRAQHVYEKIGFKKVKVNHDAWKDQLGNLQSSIDYKLSKIDYSPL